MDIKESASQCQVRVRAVTYPSALALTGGHISPAYPLALHQFYDTLSLHTYTATPS